MVDMVKGKVCILLRLPEGEIPLSPSPPEMTTRVTKAPETIIREIIEQGALEEDYSVTQIEKKYVLTYTGGA